MGPHHLLCVPFRFDQKNVALGQEDASQQAEAGGQDGKNLDSHHELSTCAEVSRDKGDPHDEEDKHAKGHTLRLTEGQIKKYGLHQVGSTREGLIFLCSKFGIRPDKGHQGDIGMKKESININHLLSFYQILLLCVFVPAV